MPHPSSPESFPVRAYEWLVCRAGHLQSLALLLFRLAWGWEMYLSGFRHLNNVDGMVKQFIEWGVPMPTASVYISGITELVGGLLLIFGLGTRVISIPLFFNFCVAIATAGSAKLHQLAGGGDLLGKNYSPGRLSAIQAIIDDTAFPFLMTALLLLAFGPGKLSIDYLLKRMAFRKSDEGHGFPVAPNNIG